MRAGLEAQLNSSEAAAKVDSQPLFSRGILRQGSGGNDVIDLQQQLNARGANLETDGDFGPKTKRAVQDFQRERGISADGVVGSDTRREFRETATNPTSSGPVDGAGNAPRAGLLRQNAEGPAVENVQRQLNSVLGTDLKTDGDFGPLTKRAVEDFQDRAGIDVDGVVGPTTRRAMREVEAGTRTLRAPPEDVTPDTPAPIPAGSSSAPTGPRSRRVSVGGNTFDVHDQTRRQFGRRSVPGRRIISLDSNSVTGRKGEVLRPLIVIPDNATPAERRAAQQSVDRVASWINDNVGGGRHTTGRVVTRSQNGRGLRGFFHTEFHSVNDTRVTDLIKQRPQEYARILGETLGGINGANFIVPHGNINGRQIEDPGAVSEDGKVTEIGLGRFLVREGFNRL